MTDDTREIADPVAEGLAILIGDDLCRNIANLGYPVGMGVAPSPGDCANAGRKIVARIKDRALALLAERSPTAPAQPGEGELNAQWVRALADKMPAMSMDWPDDLRAAWMRCAEQIFDLARPSPSARQGEPSDETVEKMARALIVHLMKDESANGLVVPVGINWRAAMRAALAAWGEGEK